MSNEALKSLLARYPDSVRPTSEPISLGNAGGLSGSRLWRWESARGRLVAKLHPNGSADPARIRQIHRWIGRASRLAFVPIPIPARDGRTFQVDPQGVWEIGPWMPGRAELADPPSLERVGLAFSALAEFHGEMGEVKRNTSSPGLTSRLQEIEGLASGGFASLRKFVTETSPTAHQAPALEWLTSAERLAPMVISEVRAAIGEPVATQPVLRDARPDHFLFTENRVTGLVDFGAMDRDVVSADIARLLNGWFSPHDSEETRAEAIASYDRIRPLTAAERDLIVVFERSGDFLGGERWLRWAYVEKRPFDDASTILRGLTKGVERIRRLIPLKSAWEAPRNPSSIVWHRPN